MIEVRKYIQLCNLIIILSSTLSTRCLIFQTTRIYTFGSALHIRHLTTLCDVTLIEIYCCLNFDENSSSFFFAFHCFLNAFFLFGFLFLASVGEKNFFVAFVYLITIFQRERTHRMKNLFPHFLIERV